MFGRSNSQISCKQCYGPNAPGLNQYCYTTGYDHGGLSNNPDPIGEGIGAFPCTLNKNANVCYSKGIMDAKHITKK